MTEKFRCGCPVYHTSDRKRYYGFRSIWYFAAVFKPVLDINVCVSLSFGIVVCKHVPVFVGYRKGNDVSVFQNRVRRDLINHRATFQPRIEIAAVIPQSPLLPEFALFAPHGNNKRLRRFHSLTADRGCNAAVGAFYPNFHSNITFSGIRKILNNSSQFDFFAGHTCAEFVFVCAAQQCSVTIVRKIIISVIGRVRKV